MKSTHTQSSSYSSTNRQPTFPNTSQMLQPIHQYSYQSNYQNQHPSKPSNNKPQSNLTLQYKTTYNSQIPSKKYSQANIKQNLSKKEKNQTKNKNEKSSDVSTKKYNLSYQQTYQRPSMVEQNNQNKFNAIKLRQQKLSNHNNKKSTQKHHQKTSKSKQKHHHTKILSQHNYIHHDGPKLFPQQGSLKQKLKQNVQQEMLNNYYMNKYENIMNRLSKEKRDNSSNNSNQHREIEYNHSFSNLNADRKQQTHTRLSNQKLHNHQNNNGSTKKRQNFKQIMKRKNNHSINQHNQSLTKRQINNHQELYHQDYYESNKYDYSYEPVKSIDKKGSKNKNGEQFMSITFSPTTKFYDLEKMRKQLEMEQRRSNNRDNNSRSKGKNKNKSLSNQKYSENRSSSVNKRRVNQEERQVSDKSKNKKSNSKILSGNKDKFYEKSNNNKSNHSLKKYLFNEENSPVKSKHSVSSNNYKRDNNHNHNHSQSIQNHIQPPNQPRSSSILSNQAYRKTSPSPGTRQNFRQSLIQKRNIHNEYDQNLQAYKKLQSSIINELYSPSPKKLQLNKWNEIQIMGRQMNAEQKRQYEIQKLKERYLNSNNDNRAGGYNNNSIHIYENEDEQDYGYQNQGGDFRNNYQEEQQENRFQGYNNRRGNNDSFRNNSFLNSSNNNNGYQGFNNNDRGQRNLSTERQSLRQKIRNSIQSNHSISSPDKNSISHGNSSSPSRKVPEQSPRRSLMMEKYAGPAMKLREQDNRQKQQWISNFSNKNSYNKNIINSTSPQKSPRSQKQSPRNKKSQSLDNKFAQKKNKTLQKIKQMSIKSNKTITNPQNAKPINTNNYIRQQQQFQSQFQSINNNKKQLYSNNQAQKPAKNNSLSYEKSPKHISFDLTNNNFINKNETKNQRQRKLSFNGDNKQQRQYQNQNDNNVRKVSQSKFVLQDKNQNHIYDSNESVNDTSEYDDQIQFVPPINESPFQFKSKDSSMINSPSSGNNNNKNWGNSNVQNRSRKPSQMSFLSDSNINHNQLSMMSRFSMTSQQGSMIIQKLQQQITENQFGPYQNALQQLRQLLNQNKTAWPIYVVGQRILDDRADYQKKIQLQGKMIKDYEDKIRKLKQIDRCDEYIETEEYKKIQRNKLEILRLVRRLGERG